MHRFPQHNIESRPLVDGFDEVVFIDAECSHVRYGMYSYVCDRIKNGQFTFVHI